MTDATTPIQKELQCPRCGGLCHWAPDRSGLLCESCDVVYNLDNPDDHKARAEFDYRANWPQQDLVEHDGTRAHGCQNCGGEVIFTGPALSEHCPYCNGPVVLSGADEAFKTMALIPFAVTRDRAAVEIKHWIEGRFAAPDDLSDIAGTGRIAGLYAPFWTFDSLEAIEYWAKYTTGSGKSRRTHSISGRFKTQFDDLLVPASPHVTPLIRDGILHEFNPERLKPYVAGYLSGFAAERHHQTVKNGLQANENDKALLIRNRIKTHINRSRVHGIKFSTDTTGIKYRRILLPVWILHYAHEGKPMKVVVSGIDGRTFGERPFSQRKLLGYSALITGLTMLIGFLWGAGNLP